MNNNFTTTDYLIYGNRVQPIDIPVTQKVIVETKEEHDKRVSENITKHKGLIVGTIVASVGVCAGVIAYVAMMLM